MTVLTWDQAGQRLYETGVDRGVLYIPTAGIYDVGYAWNGLTGVTESPSGADPTPLYADNVKYLNLLSRENFAATVEAYTYPDQFAQCDGSAEPQTGIKIHQQTRKTFGLSYRSLVGDDLVGTDKTYKLHFVYGALAAPSERAYSTVNDTPEAITFSWTVSTTEVPVTGLKPTAIVTLRADKIASTALTAIENALYGTAGTNPRLPLPDELIALVAAGAPPAAGPPAAPTYTSGTHTIAVPSTANIVYRRADTNAVVTGTNIVLTVGQVLTIKAAPASGYQFAAGSDDDWTFLY